MVPEIYIPQVEKLRLLNAAPVPVEAEKNFLNWREGLSDLVPGGVFLDKEVKVCPEIPPEAGTCRVILTGGVSGDGRLEITTIGKVAKFDLTIYGKRQGMTRQ